MSEYQIVELDGDWEVSRPGGVVATFSGIGAEQAAMAYACPPEPIVSGYKEDLLDMYESYAEDDGLPTWDKLTPKQQKAAIDAVVSLHENIDEYHAMVDAIEEAA